MSILSSAFNCDNGTWIGIQTALSIHIKIGKMIKGFQNNFADFFRYGGNPPTPLAENNFYKKPLAEMGGTSYVPIEKTYLEGCSM